MLGTAVSVFGFAYQLDLMLAGVFQAHAGVAGVTAFPPEGIFLAVALAAASAVLLLHRDRADHRATEGGPLSR